MTNKKPANEIRLGSLKATIWENTGSDGRTRYNTSVVRLYKVEPDAKEPKDSGWRETTSLGRDDLLLAARLYAECHAWILPAKHIEQDAE